MGRQLFAPLAILLFLLPLSFAYHQGTIVITPLEYKDFGNASLPTMDVLITMDCNAGKIFGTATSQGYYVIGASSNLKYIQYDNPLISTGMTDSTGQVTHTLHGNISYMNGIFIITFEKSGFQRREAHFEISDCFTQAPAQPLPQNASQPAPTPGANTSVAPPPPPPQQNATPPANATPSSGNTTTPIVPPLNLTQNATGNQTAAGNRQGIPFCPLSFVLLAALGVCQYAIGASRDWSV